jgi:hypothetical protein
VEITWPGGVRQRLAGAEIALNSRNEIVEPGPDEPAPGKQP